MANKCICEHIDFDIKCRPFESFSDLLKFVSQHKENKLKNNIKIKCFSKDSTQVVSAQRCLDQCCTEQNSNIISSKSTSKNSHNFIQNDQNENSSFQKRPLVLHCHDMAGGYNQDQNSQGNQSCNLINKNIDMHNNKNKVSSELDPFSSYNFQFQDFIDIFVYFSHSRIAIPPVVQINAAHRNDVKILGTLITEGSIGKKENKFLLNNTKLIVDALVETAKIFGFDGWFINIESSIDGYEEVIQMSKFLRKLTSKMHKEISGSLVIQYDSIIELCGSVIQQNELNYKNRIFFESCDAIFTNYFWDSDGGDNKPSPFRSRNNILTQYGKTSQKENNMKEYISNEINEALNRVFTGIDVFGRGTYAGGGFQTCKAVEVCKKAHTSIAIFAPGQTFENALKTPDKQLTLNFLQREYRFQTNKKDFEIVNTNKISNESSNSFSTKSSQKSIIELVQRRIFKFKTPFRTSFNCGIGKNMFIKGNIVKHGSQFHMSMQDRPPIVLTSKPLEYISSMRASLDFNVAYDGGSSLLIELELNQIKFDKKLHNLSRILLPLYKFCCVENKKFGRHKVQKNSSLIIEYSCSSKFYKLKKLFKNVSLVLVLDIYCDESHNSSNCGLIDDNRNIKTKRIVLGHDKKNSRLIGISEENSQTIKRFELYKVNSIKAIYAGIQINEGIEYVSTLSKLNKNNCKFWLGHLSIDSISTSKPEKISLELPSNSVFLIKNLKYSLNTNIKLHSEKKSTNLKKHFCGDSHNLSLSKKQKEIKQHLSNTSCFCVNLNQELGFEDKETSFNNSYESDFNSISKFTPPMFYDIYKNTNEQIGRSYTTSFLVLNEMILDLKEQNTLSYSVVAVKNYSDNNLQSPNISSKIQLF